VVRRVRTRLNLTAWGVAPIVGRTHQFNGGFSVSIKSLLVFGSALVATAAFAQAQLGSVASVQGVVTVTDGATGGTVAAGSPIGNGMRFVATSGGSAVLRLNNGCVIRLQAGHAVTVLQTMTCDELTAAVRPANVANFAAGPGPAGTGAFAAGGLVAGGQFMIKSIANHKSLSSN
jgi:hypothetical protein